VRLQVDNDARAIDATKVPFVLEVVNRDRVLAKTELLWDALDQDPHTLVFEADVLAYAVELRLWSAGEVDALVTSVQIDKMDQHH
jgi:hypothetical protein